MLRCRRYHGFTGAGILSGHPQLDRRPIRVPTKNLWIESLATKQQCLAGNANALPFLRKVATCSNPQPGRPGNFVHQTFNHWPTWYERLFECRAEIPQYSSVGHGVTQTVGPRFPDAIQLPQLECLKADQFGSLLEQKQAIEFEESKRCAIIDELKQQLDHETFVADFLHKCIQKLGAISQVFSEIDQSDSKSNSSSGTTGRLCLAALPPEGSTRAGLLPGYPSLDRESRDAELGFGPRTFRRWSLETVAPFRCLTAMPPEGSMRARILPGCPSLDRGSRETEVGFEPRTFRSVDSRSVHLSHLAPTSICSASPFIDMAANSTAEFSGHGFHTLSRSNFLARYLILLSAWLSGVALRGSGSIGIRGKRSVVRTRSLHLDLLSRLRRPGSIPALVLPLGFMAARHRKGAITERLYLFIYHHVLIFPLLWNGHGEPEIAQWLRRHLTDRKARVSKPEHLNCSRLSLGSLAVFQLSFPLPLVWQQGAKRVLQLSGQLGTVKDALLGVHDTWLNHLSLRC
ncbi:hypothetical protein CSKR_103270 [Clonorchis sinensis]|uniref:Uncharacterized protein n=1 Tax=Clonorchis sinensis TaxID=79923 RepID=A0A3R7FJW1_CLOSI|nr:hypothetical protein CSKR_103270 [Clonorchis sinensis]